MSITFTIGNLTNDQSSGTQTSITADTGNDIDVTLDGSNNLAGLSSGFNTFLAGLGLSAVQKSFAADVDGAASSSLIQISATGGETINDVKLLASSTTATGWTTLGGAALYLHVDSTGNYATLTTGSGAGGTIVAAFALTNEAIDNTAHTASAGVQMVTFAPINHTDSGNPDDTVALGDVLKVAVDTAMSFNFSQLAAGNFLWAAVGNSSSAMLITGQDLNVVDSGTKLGSSVSGGTDPSDMVNTSKATATTIGINAQHFAPTNSGDGATGVFTFVTGLASLKGATPHYTGGNITSVDYDNYINVSSASVFISQLTSGTSAKMQISLWEAGGGGSADHLTSDLRPEEGYNSDPNNKYSYIGNQDTDSNLKDDTPANVASVTLRGFTWTTTTSGSAHNGVTVTITGNTIVVDGAHASDLINFTTVDDPNNALDGTFNRVDIQALAGSASFDIGHIDLTSGGITSAGLGSHLFADDDGPTLLPSTDVNAPNDLQVGNVSNGHAESHYTIAAGTDGLQSFTLGGPEDTTGAFQWTYDDSTHTSIIGTYNGSDLYTLAVHSDGTYDFDMIGTIPGSALDLDTGKIKAGAPDTNSIDVGVLGKDEYVEIAGGGGAINESNAFVGVANGNLDIGESLTISLHDLNTDLITFQGISIGTKSAQSSKYHWVAHIDGGGTLEGDITVPKNGTILLDQGLLLGDTIDSITVTKVTGSATKIGLGDVHIIVQPDDALLPFTVQALDGDNDPASANFTVAIDGNNDGSYDAVANSSLVVQSNTISSTSVSKYSGMHIASADLGLTHPLLDMVHYHADYMLI